MIQIGKIIVKGDLLSTRSIRKQHNFVERKFESSSTPMSIIGMLTIFLALITNSSTSFDMLYTTSGITIISMINGIEPLINGAMAIVSRLTTDLNSTGYDYITFNSIYPVLSQIMLKLLYLINLVQHNLSYSVGSADFNQLQDLFNRLLDTARFFLSIYRQVEGAMGIPLDLSPVSTQQLGF